MLDTEGWLPQAKQLEVGKSQRVGHDCGPGSCMLVSHDLDCYRAYCFRCGEPGYVAKVPTLADQVELRKVKEADSQLRTAVLPVPMENDVLKWPTAARLWLYKAGISNRRIEELGIYYHPPSRRVVVPVIEKGQVTYWQARAVMPDQVPKYLNPAVDRSKVLPRFGQGHFIVLTEDYLSAVRVGEVTEAWSLLGTQLKEPVLAELVREDKPVACWLDPDKAGVKGNSTISKTLRSLGIDVTVVVSEKDPKFLSKERIRECLSQFF